MLNFEDYSECAAQLAKYRISEKTLNDESVLQAVLAAADYAKPEISRLMSVEVDTQRHYADGIILGCFLFSDQAKQMPTTIAAKDSLFKPIVSALDDLMPQIEVFNHPDSLRDHNYAKWVLFFLYAKPNVETSPLITGVLVTIGQIKRYLLKQEQFLAEISRRPAIVEGVK